jgi:peroxiredoxin
MSKMKMYRLLIAIVFILNAYGTQAQIQTLKKTIVTVEALKSLSYTATSAANNPFSGELYDTKATIKISRLNDTTKALAYYINSQSKSNGGFTENSTSIFNQKDLLLLNHDAKTYHLKKENKGAVYAEYNIYKLIDHLKSIIKTGNFNFQTLKDSLVNKQDCYHISIKTKDSVFNKTNSYENMELLINKSNNLPIFWKSDQQGVMEKGGIKIGTIKLNSFTYAANFVINTVKPNAFTLTIPKGFKEEKPPLPLLSKGSPAPNWQLADTEGKKLSMASLKGKIVLLDITSTSCPACELSVGPLNNLHQKYKGTNVVVLSINLDDTKETILKFKSKNNIHYPIYLDGKLIKAKYHISAIPVFYIVDQQGVIKQAYEGFFEGFEEKVSADINKLML